MCWQSYETNPEKEKDGVVYGNRKSMEESQEDKRNNKFKLGTCVEAHK